MDAYERLMLPENLNYAWLKAKNLYRMDDGYIDHGELAEFELDLEKRLAKIRKQFERGNYRLKKLRPLPRPKQIKDGDPVNRQYYHVSVDDQVAWIAIANVFGPELDLHMPAWSYGNRIYRPAWYDENENQPSALKIGPYRHARGYLYRKFQHSWPLFRRHVGLAARTMVRAQPLDHEELDQAERSAFAAADRDKLPYLTTDFWAPHRGGESESRTELYHASFDLKQFYPSVKIEAVLNGLTSSKAAQDGRLQKLLKDMLHFRIDRSNLPPEALGHVEPDFDETQIHGIPTGLFVAGFLANVAMLRIDTAVNERIEDQRAIAHFRFVDDHAILAYEFKDLCKWIEEYRQLLEHYDIGATIHPEKFNPASLGELLSEQAKNMEPDTVLTNDTLPTRDKKEETAIRETKLDGKSPTKLLTKTLGQVSAIAATNFDILDDEDLGEQLKLLEWLLLADIPEHEIRPDTRASFAASRIAILAPTLIRETDGLVDAARSLADFKVQTLDLGHAAEANDPHKYLVALETQLMEQQEVYKQNEKKHLRRYFRLLLQAFHKFPSKARLFHKLCDYCRKSGFHGLSEIIGWIAEARSQGYGVWADYYTGLMLQILAQGVLLASRAWQSDDALRSDKDAALSHLKNVGSINLEEFLIPHDKEAWFHTMGRKEFGVALLSVAEVLQQDPMKYGLSTQFKNMAGRCLIVSFNDSAQFWKKETLRSPGVWAHLVESFLSIYDKPSLAWKQFELLFSSSHVADIQALRRYPEFLSDANWGQFLHLTTPLPISDSGWLWETMHGNRNRIDAALGSKKRTFRRTAKSIKSKPSDRITLTDWTEFILHKCDPFDPRRSEWTALEIVRQIILAIKNKFSFDQSTANLLHPNNIHIPENWREKFPYQENCMRVSWEDWKKFTQVEKIRLIRPRSSKTRILEDYRYSATTTDNYNFSNWERFLVSIGRLLLGQLRLSYDTPKIWNIRGNEQVSPLPRTRWFNSLAISSLTLLVMESCLTGRSAETRVMFQVPELFGLNESSDVNDTKFDPPPLNNLEELLGSIKRAQRELESNQLSVLMNQPRQLIPFRLKDFSAGPNDEDESIDIE